MECDNHRKNGLHSSAVHVRGSQVGLELDAGGTRTLRLDGAPGVAGALAGGSSLPMVPAQPPQQSFDARGYLHPFMNTMDEISFWVVTKRAPCLMNYDNTYKKQGVEAHTSKTKPKSVPSAAEVPSPKKKKRKLSLLDDDSGSADKQQNVYFDPSQTKKQVVLSSCKSNNSRSDIDFNIKVPTIKAHKKTRSKLQKSCRTTLHKKNKLVASTPKAPQLRRSLRQQQQNVVNNSQLNNSFEVFNASIINGDNREHCITDKSLYKTKKCAQILAGEDQNPDNQKNTTVNKLNNTKNELLDGQFEDLSDVSGFTANYIRSTKLQATKTSKKLKCKNNRNLVKESQHSVPKDNTLVVSVNKSMNTNPKSGVFDCSTDSVNVINLVTTNCTDKSSKVNKATSLLKFLDLKIAKESPSTKIDGAKTKPKINKNVSFQSNSSSSRYPKRYTNNSAIQEETAQPAKKNIHPDKKRKISKNSSEFNNSDRKENPEDSIVSRTRSGRSIGLTLRQPENSVLVLSNCTEQVSSVASMNVAMPAEEPSEQIKKRSTRYQRSRKISDKHDSVQKDSLRDKSGFTACFSDSDDDSEPLKQRKYFCT